jgi:uncharacterized protein
MQIIDTHTHFGMSKLFREDFTEHNLLKAMDDNGVAMAIVLPHSTTDDPAAAHDAVAELCSRHPKRLRGIVNLSPVQDEADYRREATRCVRTLGFVGIKLNPPQHLTSPIMPNANKLFDTANDLGVPVIVHTGSGIPWALPSLCIPQARRHPQLPIVLGHAGMTIYSGEAYVAASECANIYLEPSWCSVQETQAFVDKIGVERMMFGSDVPENLPIELAKCRSLRLSDVDRVQFLSGTARKVFRL